MSEDAEETIVDAFKSAWDAQDPDAVSSLFAEGGTYLDPHLETEATGEEIREYVEEIYAVFPDFRFEWHRSFITPETALVEWTTHGTNTGSFGKIPPTGNAIAVPGCSIITFSEEGITEQRDYWDQQMFRRQLGLTFPAIVAQLPVLVWKMLRR